MKNQNTGAVNFLSKYFLGIYVATIKPNSLVLFCFTADMVAINYKGMIMNPFTLHWSWTDMLSMNYMCYARKPNWNSNFIAESVGEN